MEKKIFAKHKILWLGRATGESRVWGRKALRLRALSEKLQLRREIMGRLTQRVLAFFSYKVKMKEKTGLWCGIWKRRTCRGGKEHKKRDGTGPATRLTALVEQALGGSAWDHIAQLYQKDVAYIASFAPLVQQAYREKDDVACAKTGRLAMCVPTGTGKISRRSGPIGKMG